MREKWISKKDEALAYMEMKLHKSQCNLKMAEVRHDNAALPNIKRKIRVYTMAVKALRAYGEE